MADRKVQLPSLQLRAELRVDRPSTPKPRTVEAIFTRRRLAADVQLIFSNPHRPHRLEFWTGESYGDIELSLGHGREGDPHGPALSKVSAWRLPLFCPQRPE